MIENLDYLRSIVGARVRRVGLLVWPDSEGLRNTDVQLHLDVDCEDGIRREITCRTDADGQSPRIEFEDWAQGIPISRMGERLRLWATPEFWNSNTTYGYELFETACDEFLGIGVNSVITTISVIVFLRDRGSPTGLVIEFDNKNCLWSAPHAHGNYVGRTADDFIWPSDVALVPVI